MKDMNETREAAQSAMTRKRLYDREYATEWRKERDWLAERGFLPIYVKRQANGVDRYKYRKSAALFENLVVFYQMEEAAREWRRIEHKMAEARAIGTGNMSAWHSIANGGISDAFQAADDEWEDDTI